MRYPLSLGSSSHERACGECQACCEAIAVTELGKGTWTRCQHQCESGCGIHPERPVACRDYYCAWQAGILDGDERRRPDKLGLILDFRSRSDNPEQVVVSVWEIREGAANSEPGRYLLKKIAERAVVYVRSYRSTARRIMGPRTMVQDLEFEEIEA